MYTVPHLTACPADLKLTDKKELSVEVRAALDRAGMQGPRRAVRTGRVRTGHHYALDRADESRPPGPLVPTAARPVRLSGPHIVGPQRFCTLAACGGGVSPSSSQHSHLPRLPPPPTPRLFAPTPDAERWHGWRGGQSRAEAQRIS